MTEKSPVLLRLTSLRAFAALLVFLFHVRYDGVFAVPGVAMGYTGVAFFFVLSGFVLTWSIPASMSKRTFLRNRFARIYPAATVLAVCSFLLPIPGFGQGIGGALLRFLLLQAWVPINSVAFGGNSPTWSLSCEVAFYVALPFLLLFLHRIGWTIKVIVSVAYFLLASSFVAVVALHGLTAPWLAVFAYANPLVRFGEFLLGVVAALAIKNGWIMKVPLAAVLIGLSVLGLALTRAYPLPDAILTPLFLAVIVLAAQRDLQRPKGLLASRWMVYAGEVSFSFYLVHQLVIENVGHLIGHGGLPVAAVDFLVSVLAAVLVHHAVEVPCQALIRGRLSAARSIAVHPEALAD